jgi:hypothetical protein
VPFFKDPDRERGREVVGQQMTRHTIGFHRLGAFERAEPVMLHSTPAKTLDHKPSPWHWYILRYDNLLDQVGTFTIDACLRITRMLFEWQQFLEKGL